MRRFVLADWTSEKLAEANVEPRQVVEACGRVGVVQTETSLFNRRMPETPRRARDPKPRAKPAFCRYLYQKPSHFVHEPAWVRSTWRLPRGFPAEKTKAKPKEFLWPVRARAGNSCFTLPGSRSQNSLPPLGSPTSLVKHVVDSTLIGWVTIKMGR